MPRRIEVIVSDVSRGKGVTDDPCRNVVQYHDMDGLFLAEYDPWAEERNARNAETVKLWPSKIAEERATKVEAIHEARKLIRDMDSHEGAEGWSADLRTRIDAFLAKGNG